MDTNTDIFHIWSQSLLNSDWGVELRWQGTHLDQSWVSFSSILIYPNNWLKPWKTWTYIIEIITTLKLIRCVLWLLGLVIVPSTNIEEARFMTYTAASHQEATKMIWLHLLGAVLFTVYSLSRIQQSDDQLLNRQMFNMIIKQLHFEA